jgi:two-component system, cell cycle response regulator CpdR
MQTALEVASVTATQATLGGAFGETRPQRKTILLVEPEAFVRKATAEVLQSAGYGVTLARSAIEALEACGRYSQVDLLLLSDVKMSGMNGRELAEKFNILRPQAQVLLMSGSEDELASGQLSPYCRTYLGKPFSASVLLRKVSEALDETLPLRNL